MEHTAIAIVVREDGFVLMQKREDFRIWGFPGGYVEPDEPYADAAVRETYEETGLHVTVTRHVAEFTQPQFNNQVHLYQCQVVGGEIIKRSAETIDVKWFSPTEMPTRCTPNTIRYLSAMQHEHPTVIHETIMHPHSLVIARGIALSLRNLRNRLFRR